MSTTQEATAEVTTEQAAGSDMTSVSSYDSEPENWLSRAIGIFLGLAVSAAAVGGVIGLLHLHAH